MSLIFSSSRLAGAVLLSALAGATVAHAEQTRPREAVISVSGEGEASIAPDMAYLTLAVLRSAKTAESALAANSAAMKEVLAALKASGVADRDVQTSNFAIQPRYRHAEPKDGVVEPPQVIGYEVSNTLTLKVRDLSRLGALIDQSVKLGVNQGGQIVFSNDDPAQAMTDARKAAMAEAMDKAKTLTDAAGIRLGRVLEISENADRPMPPQPMMRMAMAKDMAESVPVASGENTYRVTVNVTFALEQ